MKMLLTSNGVQNSTLQNALQSLLGKPIHDSKIVYVLTATLIEEGNHSWCVDDLNRLYGLGWAEFNMMELNGIPKDNIQKRLQNADAVFCEGGNVYHLANSIIVNDLVDVFEETIRDKVYVGASAGSMIFSKSFNEKTAELFNEIPQLTQLGISTISSPFNYFEWYLKPHLNSVDFPERTDAWIETIAIQTDFPIYALDDQSAIVVDDSSLKVVSEGRWRLLK
jgi:dipeptidase E